MAENITLNNIATFQNDTSAANTYNSNNTAIVNAFADVLSRSGVGPNQMQSTLDMNNFQIINLPAPTTASSPARLLDISGGQITVVTATTGTSGHVVPFLDGTNTWSNTQTITIPSGLSQGLLINQTATGSTGGSSLNLNNVSIADTINAGSGTVQGLAVLLAPQSSAVSGPRTAIQGQSLVVAATNAGSAKTYFGVQGISAITSADGGTNPNSSGTSLGEVQGGNFLAQLGASATAIFATLGMEVNTACATGSSTWAKALGAFAGAGSDLVAGTVVNTMLWLYNHTGAVKWSSGILIDNLGGLGQFPIATTGTVFRVTGGTFTNGIDFTNNTISNNPYMSNAFSVNSGGAITSGGVGLASGNLILNGITSGNATFSANSTANLITLSQPFQVGIIGTTAGTITIAGLTSGSAALSCSATGSLLQLGSGNVTIDTSGNITTNGVLTVGATQSTATAGGLFLQRLGNITTFGIYTGSGAPTVTAAQGSLYLRTDGSTNVTRAYINTTGSNVWTAINTVA